MKQYSYIDFLAQFGISSAHPGGLACTMQIFEQEAIKADMKILDVGCGLGETTSYLAKKYSCHVFGIENHPIMLEKAKKRVGKSMKRMIFQDGSIEALLFGDGDFDYLLSESVLSFVDVKKALTECQRVLKDNGVLILNEMTVLQSLTENEMEELKSFYGFKGCYQLHQWKELLRKNGFKRIEEFQAPRRETIETNQIELSDELNPRLLDMLDEHERLAKKYAGKIGNVILRCER